jgi:hypothetical protein
MEVAMPRPIQLVLAYCFAKYPLDANGDPSNSGLSNYAIGEWFRRVISEIAGDRILVLATEDPINAQISKAVKDRLDSADALICIFPKRVKCPYSGWTTSQYVISESGYAACRFRHEAEQRMFGFIEGGVNRSWLGLAFPPDRPVFEFTRDNLEALRPKLVEIIQQILGDETYVADQPQYLLLRKRVRVRRDGRTEIQTLHRFRMRRHAATLRIPHTLWRVREKLPDFERMRELVPARNGDYFRFSLRQCGSRNPANVRATIHDPSLSANGKEVSFWLGIGSADLKPGDVLEYEFAWSYSRAFLRNDHLASWETNSTGLRVGSLGPVGEAVMQVLFERFWFGGETPPAVELTNGDTGPKIHLHPDTTLPGYLDQREFWHRHAKWYAAGCMKPCPELTDPLVEAYEWRRSRFSGLVRASWNAPERYHVVAQRTRRRDERIEGPDGVDDENDT